jgi:chromosome partitioning protein
LSDRQFLLSNTDIELTTAIDYREARLKIDLDKIAGENGYIILGCP